jgi:hypothetical protein
MSPVNGSPPQMTIRPRWTTRTRSARSIAALAALAHRVIAVRSEQIPEQFQIEVVIFDDEDPFFHYV